MVVVTTEAWGASNGTLWRFARVSGTWQKQGEPVPVTVGSAGLGWGSGLHPGADGPVKREGDRRSPAGVFHIGAAYGYAASAPPGTGTDYRQLRASDRCVDDSSSKHYNQIVDATAVNGDWKSAEIMRRDDELYRWVVLIEHNARSPVPDHGSCIFFHVWRDRESPTVGCTAMGREDIESLMRWLAPSATPVAVVLPRGVYDQLRSSWSLPQLDN